jgi:eukaryotic-like serine/threonine-protein kinase
MQTETVHCPSCQRSYPVGITVCPADGANLSNAPDGQTLEPGLKIGEYILEKKIGEGGMGEVWSAKQPQINKVVAIKFLRQKLVNNDLAVARFMQEARAVNEIQHRNIVDIFSFGELADGRPYFVMEFLKGQSLSAHLSEVGPLPCSEILRIFEQVCDALQAGHELNIIHRDLKPDNLFLVASHRSGRGEALFSIKVLDFGIAKLKTTSGASLTDAGATMGTPLYMSPEQYEDAKTVGQSSDIYALGIILFELLTGRTPFYEPGDGLGAVLSRQMFTPAVAPSTLVSGRNIPPEVDAIVLKALAKNPKERYLRCLDFYDALVKAIGPLANETFDSIRGASPLYSNQSGPEKTLVGIDPGELSKKTPNHDSKNISASRTGDFYSSNKPSELETLSAVSLKKGVGFFVFVGSMLCLGVGITFLFSSSGKETASLTTNTIIRPASVTTKVKVIESTVSIPDTVPTSQPVINTPSNVTKEKAVSKKTKEPTVDKPHEPNKRPQDENKPKLLFDKQPKLLFDGK